MNNYAELAESEKCLRSIKQEAETGLVIGDEIGMRDALRQILAEVDARFGITTEERPWTVGLAVNGRSMADFESLLPHFEGVCAAGDVGGVDFVCESGLSTKKIRSLD